MVERKTIQQKQGQKTKTDKRFRKLNCKLC